MNNRYNPPFDEAPAILFEKAQNSIKALQRGTVKISVAGFVIKDNETKAKHMQDLLDQTIALHQQASKQGNVQAMKDLQKIAQGIIELKDKTGLLQGNQFKTGVSELSKSIKNVATTVDQYKSANKHIMAPIKPGTQGTSLESSSKRNITPKLK